MGIVTVRGLQLGDGRCKIIVPLVAKNADDAVRLAGELAAQNPDLLEWRADHLAQLRGDAYLLLYCLREIRRAIGELPLLVTWRTKKEGGELDLPPEEYLAFCRTVCESGYADLLDVEFTAETAARDEIFHIAKQNGVKVVCSSHDFAKTPAKEEMVDRLCRMQQTGAHIAKLAVIPHTRSDVTALLSATAEMADLHPETPVLTMSMGALGQISRIAGGVLGSCATFAAAGNGSAPGQLSLEATRAALELLR